MPKIKEPTTCDHCGQRFKYLYQHGFHEKRRQELGHCPIAEPIPETKRKIKPRPRCEHCHRPFRNQFELDRHLEQRRIWGACVEATTDGYQRDLANNGWTDDDFCRELT